MRHVLRSNEAIRALLQQPVDSSTPEASVPLACVLRQARVRQGGLGLLLFVNSIWEQHI
jgi:hypothetical protein